MKPTPEGNAIVYCEGAFNTPNGKTAHGLVRFTERYHVCAVIDSRYAGQDAGAALDRKANGIPIVRNLDEAIQAAQSAGYPATHLVIGLAPDGGKLPDSARKEVKKALQQGMNVDSGLHDFLSDDPDLVAVAQQHDLRIRDIRKPPLRSELHFFSGKIEQVKALTVAVLGTDSAVGKRTTAWLLVHGLRAAGIASELVGTGQTAWMQGARHSLVMDSLINDFVSGEIEHAVYNAWQDKAEVIVIEGQGSLMNPAYPGGFEILAAGRPDIVLLQHAPARKEYDGFPGYPLHPIQTQIQVIELLSGKPVVAITVNHEEMEPEAVPEACELLTQETGLPAYDVLLHGAAPLVKTVLSYLSQS